MQLIHLLLMCLQVVTYETIQCFLIILIIYVLKIINVSLCLLHCNNVVPDEVTQGGGWEFEFSLASWDLCKTDDKI